MPLSDDLQCYYSCEEASGDLIDAHGADDFTDVNTVGSGTGKVSGGRDFESGGSERFSLTSNSRWQFGDNPRTICFWFNAETLGNFARLMSKNDGSVNQEWDIKFDPFDSDKVKFFVGSDAFGGTTTEVGWSSGSSTSTWYFVAVKHDPTNNVIGISVNGGAWQEAAHSAGVYNGSAGVRIGCRSDDTQFYDGLMDEIGLWHRVLTLSEVQDLYNSGSGRDYAYVSGASATPVTIWRLKVGAAADPYWTLS